MDKVEEEEFVVITPEWVNLTRYFAYGLVDHLWSKGYTGAVSAFIEQIRYLEHKDPEFLDKLIKELNQNVTR